MALTGFMTGQLAVKKAERKHIEGIVRLYGVDKEQQQQLASRWQSIIDRAKDDYHNDVIFVIKSRRKRIIGLVRAKALEDNSVSIEIWFSNSERKEKYLRHLIESIVEYYTEYENYEYISEIKVLEDNFTYDNKISVKAS